ncbi:MAG: hypothetical protein NC187_00510 [Candidatus Amulumruptor caecigallinarius]|nr:hypothetical protein [Candidatus Amulumruptor caecigallinarius]MCM1395958.1 hypothetical protein [Candidatus Amulumruptor caecigallinarius]MCM1452993.1 hypothetical protein [bacterium]
MERHNITVTWSNGDQTTTDINGTRYEICKYYENKTFTCGFDDGHGWKEYQVKAVHLHFND